MYWMSEGAISYVDTKERKEEESDGMQSAISTLHHVHIDRKK